MVDESQFYAIFPNAPRSKRSPLRIDPTAASADPGVPAFIARPPGKPVYYGFPLIEESRIEGWCFGAITEFEDPKGSRYGDAFIEAPDGSRAGLVWEVGEGDTEVIREPEPDRWGVYAVWLSKPIKDTNDFVSSFHAILPELKAIYAQVKASTKPDPTA